MTAGDVLLRDILEQPEDDSLRLVYADWLEDQGQSKRAEFIRLQIAVAGMTCSLPSALAHADRWSRSYCTSRSCRHCNLFKQFQPMEIEYRKNARELGLRFDVDGDVEDVYLWRGFGHTVVLRPATFMLHARTLFSCHPVEKVVLACAYPTFLIPQGDHTHAWLEVTSSPLAGGATIHPEIHRLLRGGYRDNRMVTYTSPEKAYLSLSRACVHYGRRAAGLKRLDLYDDQVPL